ncbi:MAG: hypothetical protein HY553_19965, partial [Elusimicrobia bacterium]|nr:hypothetical protein [Elusimicrobiota bacterium]
MVTATAISGTKTDDRGPGGMWSSPIAIGLALMTVANAGWLTLFLFHITVGDRTYAFPEGLRQFISPYLTVRQIDLTYPVVILYDIAMAAAPAALLAHPSVRDAARRTALWPALSGRSLWTLAA